ncbi:threonine ammonia-lyase IlvA [Trueperella sp. LYQ141]|uniref:threonine ammonia-lyase IlvA n=1 Tax=Trueperella sp. LYQ141 TaxID=3391058 RepID=UPI0039832B7B
MDTQRVSGTDVVVAAQTLGQTVRTTPCEPSARLSNMCGYPVYLKREDIQVGRSYKVRGAYNVISGLSAQDVRHGVVCASAGNHAQGVAFACHKKQIPGTIFIPSTTPRQKRSRIADIGGEWVTLQIMGSTFDESSQAAISYAKEVGATYIHPFDDPRTIAGQGTVVKEIFSQVPQQPASVLVPVGGGGLLAGTLAWIKQFHPDVTVIGVEPAGAASMRAALDAGAPQTLSDIDTFADGTAVARVGDLTFTLVQELCDHVITVPEGAICSEMLDLYHVEGIITEPAGALASAALRGYVNDYLPEGPVACIVSGGNNDVLRYDDIVERSMIHEGLRHYFLVTFPQKPGALRGFLDDVLSDGEDIIQFEYTKKNNRDMGPALVGIEIDDPAGIDALLERMHASELDIEKLEPNSPAFRFVL